MSIKNYTSEIPASTSMAKIEKLLVSAGGRKIMKDYDDKEICTAISFQLPVNGNLLGFMLPAKVDAVYRILINQYTRPTEKSFEICRRQAERTAWKIISEWVEIQIAMIKMEQAEIAQVFLPYIHDGNESFYDKVKSGDYKLLK